MLWRSELQRRIEKMILPSKQSEDDSANRQKDCVSAKPKSVPWQSGKAKRRDNQKKDTCHQEPTNGMERLQPGIDGIPKEHDVLQSLAKHQDRRENEKHLDEANNSRKEIKNTIAFGAEERTLIAFADYDRKGPQQHGQECKQQTSTNQETFKNLARVPRNALSFVDRGEGEHFGDSTGWVPAKAYFLQAIYLPINERSDFAPSL